MTRAVMVAVIAVVLVPTASAGPAGFYESRLLEPMAGAVAKKPVAVWCALTDDAFLAFYGDTSAADVNGYAQLGGSNIYLRNDICFTLRRALTLGWRNVASEDMADALLTLIHESVHAAGVSDESVTDCIALRLMPGVASKFIRYRHDIQLHYLMASAWAFHDAKPPQYRTLC